MWNEGACPLRVRRALDLTPRIALVNLTIECRRYFSSIALHKLLLLLSSKVMSIRSLTLIALDGSDVPGSAADRTRFNPRVTAARHPDPARSHHGILPPAIK